MSTFAGQDKLAKLPIPPLNDTCEKYLSVLKPLQTPEEHEETKNAVKDFLNRQGPFLDEKLRKYAKSRSSYIEQFWYDSYLNYDSPVVLNLNPFFLLEDDPAAGGSVSMIQRAVSLIMSSLSFVRAIRREELPPDTIRGNKPLCMYQYSRLFGTARIACENGCVMQTDATSRHIVIAVRSQFYWFDVLDQNSDLVLTEQDLAQNLETILNDAQNINIAESAKSAVGVLTSENRRIWAHLRQIITRENTDDPDYDPNNSECLHIIDSALFVVCLDSVEPNTPSELAQNMLCGLSIIERGVQVGSCTNRWYDKLQIIVTRNAHAGINFEHTGVDGHTVLRFASDIFADSILRLARSITGKAPSIWVSDSPDPSKRDPASFDNIATIPRKLEWKNLSPEVTVALRFAESRMADLIHQNEFEILDFRYYGQNFIKQSGFSPDAFVQMAFQAAYYALYGNIVCTYEPAMTKYFLHGRTEAIRTVSEESVAFVRKFCEAASPEVKIEHLKKACEAHSAKTKDCAQGLGQDRHLYALFCVWQRQAQGLLDDEVDENTISHKIDNGKDIDENIINNNNNNNNNNNIDEDNDDSVSVGSYSSCDTNEEDFDLRDMPAIFADPGWSKLNNTILSTSNCGNPALKSFGFGPTSPEGFGLGYIIKDKSISVCASSKHRQTRRYLDTLQNYLLEVRNVIRATKRASEKTHNKSSTRAREGEEENENGLSRINSLSRNSLGASTSTLNLRGRVLDPTVSFSSNVGDKINSSDGKKVKDVDSPSSDSAGDMLSGYGYFDMGEMEALLREISHTPHTRTPHSRTPHSRTPGTMTPGGLLGLRPLSRFSSHTSNHLPMGVGLGDVVMTSPNHSPSASGASTPKTGTGSGSKSRGSKHHSHHHGHSSHGHSSHIHSSHGHHRSRKDEKKRDVGRRLNLVDI